MNKINPLYLLALFFIVMIVSFTRVQTAQDELKQEVNTFKEYSKKAVEFNTLNEVVQKSFVDKILNEIKNDRHIKNANLSVKSKTKSYVLSLNKANEKAQEQLINKILNSKLLIKTLYLDKNKMEVEIFYE